MRTTSLAIISLSLVMSFDIEAQAQMFKSPVDPCDGGVCMFGSMPSPSPVGDCGGLCMSNDYFRHVQVFGVPPVQGGWAESLAISRSEARGVTPPRHQLLARRNDLAAGVAAINTTIKICSSRATAPSNVWREALMQRPALLSCQKAARPLLEQRVADRDAYMTYLQGGAVRTPHAFENSFRSYNDACLQPLDKYSNTPQFQALFGENFSQSLTQNVGTLTGSSGGQPYQCMASVVRLGGEPARLGLVTSAHCIGTLRKMGLDGKQIDLPLDKLSFSSLSGDEIAVKVEPDVRGWMISERTDLALIPAADGLEADFSGLPLGDPAALNALDPLYLVGVNPIAMALAYADRAETGRTVKPLDGATITLSAPCRVVGIDRGRLVHNCDTEKQMSGSPIFALGPDGPRLIAVHNEGLDAAEPLASCGLESWPAINHAVIVPSAHAVRTP